MDVRARKHGSEIIPTPVWVLVVRIFQIVLSIIALGMAGWWIHGLYLNELGFVIACCVFTWIVSLYNILSEKAAACRPGYNTWAALSLDGLLIVFWLAAVGATASARAAFRYSVTASCTSDGSAVNSGHCDVLRRRYADDDVVGVASYAALDMLSGLAGVCALVMLLFVASFAYVCHFFRLSYTEANAVPDPEKHGAGVVLTAGAPASTGTAAAPGYHMNAGTEMTPQVPVAQQGVPHGSQQQQQPQYQYQGQQQQQPSPMMHHTSNVGYTQQPTQEMGYGQNQTPTPYTQNNVHGTGMHSPGQVGQQQYAYSPGGMAPQGPVQ
ncbi:hypothetical protein PG994_011748 [Apiospora phragmitis]|uniref:MARVEL domain-containing protein n=1 Tax=Apiospora phragmitis TaxID=2905665 RepID=A0ABR1TTY2_9PEZI